MAPALPSNISINYPSRWYIMEALPVILAGSIAVVVVLTRSVQLLQRAVFRVLPFGALAALSLVDVCVGIFITGLYYLYFRTSRVRRWLCSRTCMCVCGCLPAPDVICAALPPVSCMSVCVASMR